MAEFVYEIARVWRCRYLSRQVRYPDLTRAYLAAYSFLSHSGNSFHSLRSIMPIPAAISHAAEEFRYNSHFAADFVKDLTPEEWVKRPEGAANHIAWIVGHVIWARTAVLTRLGATWSAPWIGLFARGAKVDDSAAYPSPDTLMAAWHEVSDAMKLAFENASDELVARPAPQPGPPSADGKLSGTIRFLAWHETYHVGQISYVRSLLGKKSLMG